MKDTPEPTLDDLLELERKGFIELKIDGDEIAFRIPGFVDSVDGFPPGEAEAQARDTLAVTWRELFGGDPLPGEVEERALPLLLSGCSGVPGQFICFDIDPREALAEALGTFAEAVGQ